MDPVMELFLELVHELVSAKDTERLEFIKRQFEADRIRIGDESRLMEKYRIVCDALISLRNKDRFDNPNYSNKTA
jgi:hypothetical protein